MTPPELSRCGWARSPAEQRYHDEEWGVPVHEDRVLFEFLVLEGAQAGLSWSTILAKREGYRRAFLGFDPARVARMGQGTLERLVQDPSIVRHRGKIEGTVRNARAFLALAEEFGSFDAYLWAHVAGEPVRNAWRSLSEVPATTPLSEAISKDLRRRGFTFVGPTILYAFLQAVGVVDDHLVGCFRSKRGPRRKA